MTRLERRIREGWPHWFTGPRAALADPLLRLLGRWSGLDEAEAFLRGKSRAVIGRLSQEMTAAAEDMDTATVRT